MLSCKSDDWNGKQRLIEHIPPGSTEQGRRNQRRHTLRPLPVLSVLTPIECKPYYSPDRWNKLQPENVSSRENAADRPCHSRHQYARKRTAGQHAILTDGMRIHYQCNRCERGDRPRCRGEHFPSAPLK